MRQHNVYKYDVLTKHVVEEALFEFHKMIENIGFDILYYVYDRDARVFSDPVSIKCFIIPADNLIEENIKLQWRVDALFSATQFVENEIEPSENDKIIFNDNEYYIRNIIPYNATNQLVNTIKSCVFFQADLIQKNQYTRTNTIR